MNIYPCLLIFLPCLPNSALEHQWVRKRKKKKKRMVSDLSSPVNLGLQIACFVCLFYVCVFDFRIENKLLGTLSSRLCLL